MSKKSTRENLSTAHYDNNSTINRQRINIKQQSHVETPPASPTNSTDSSKACCFCWCCCCSCSWPTIEEVESWADSFEKLMQHPAGRFFFREFLRSEYSEENMLFWQACEELKAELTPEEIEEKARLVYEDFISILSPREVSLDSRVREIINHNMVDPSPHTFDEAQLQIYTLMHRDSYPRFLNSPLYKKLLHEIDKNSKG